MTREEAIELFKDVEVLVFRDVKQKYFHEDIEEAFKLAIEALEQEPRKDEVILTKEEYGKLISSEFDNGYAKGYREALEQEPILDKIRAEIEQLRLHKAQFLTGDNKVCIDSQEVLNIIDKYKEESDKESEE